MRRFSLLAVACLSLLGCSRGSAPDGATVTPAAVPGVAPAPTAVRKTPAAILRPAPVPGAPRVAFTSRTEAGVREVWIVAEDAPSAATRISTAGVDTTFAGAVGKGATLLSEHDAKGAVVRLVRQADGSPRIALGAPAAGVYDHAVTSRDIGGGSFAVLLSRVTTGVRDLLLFSAGTPPKLLASDASIVAITGGRIAYLSGTALKSVAVDGTGTIALGGGDDAVVNVDGDRLLVNAGGGASKDVKLVSLDGTVRFSLARPDVDEVAVGISDDRVVFTRAGALIAAPIDGTAEVVLAPAERAPRALAAVPGSLAIWGDSTGALLAADLHGGGSRVLDPSAGADVIVARVSGDRILYVGDNPGWKSLRAARLDGSGVSVLYSVEPWVPFVVAVDGDTVVFHRVLAGQPGGGRVSGVSLDGGPITDVGAFVQGASGDVAAAPVADQDFESVTPNGSLIVEAEMESHGSSQLFLMAHAGAPAELVTGELEHVRFAAIIP